VTHQLLYKVHLRACDIINVIMHIIKQVFFLNYGYVEEDEACSFSVGLHGRQRNDIYRHSQEYVLGPPEAPPFLLLLGERSKLRGPGRVDSVFRALPILNSWG